MSINYTKARGTDNAWKPNKGGSIDSPYAVIGVVKNNIDSTRSGKLEVYIADFGGVDPNEGKNWTPVSYVSPFFGITIPEASSQGEGDWTVNPNSYGMWATAPDIGTEVLCVFVNGVRDFGYYIGCIPRSSTTFMVPAVGATAMSIVANNEAQAEAFSGAKRLPVTETNINDYTKDDGDPESVSRPVHGYVAARLVTQGLIRDNIRGTISSSSMRESPSRVFGMSTPGKPIRQKSPNPNKSDVHHREGGHSFVMDDGDKDDKNCLIRLRTSLGHQITMSDDGETLFVIHANGQSYIELGKEGTVDIFSTNSFNVRTQGDINFHADRDINLNAKKKLNIRAEEINLTSDKNTNQRVGENFKMQTIGDHTIKVDKGVSIGSTADASFASSAVTYINGSKINLNTGSTSLKPEKVDELTLVAHPDTTGDAQKGYLSVPGTLKSITSRAPAHAPWGDPEENTGHGSGVDAKASATNSDTIPDSPSDQVNKANNSAGSGASGFPINDSIASTVPNSKAVGGNIDKNTVAAATAQRASNVASAASNVKNNIKTDANGNKALHIGKLGQTPEEMEKAGIIKPGASKLANELASQGNSIDQCLPPNVFTGKNGVTDINSYLTSPNQQVNCQVFGMQQGYADLQNKGVITGNESSNQITGLVVSTGQYGTNNTVKYVDGMVGDNNISTAISSGNYAANVADKIISPSGALSGLSGGISGLLTSGKNAIQSIFNSIKSALIPIPLNKPVNLGELSGAASTLLGKATNVGAGLAAVVLGTKLISSLTKENAKDVNSLAKSATDAKPLLSGDSLTNATADSNKINQALSSLISSGPEKLKLPVTGADTFDSKAINSLATNIAKVSTPKPPTTLG